MAVAPKNMTLEDFVLACDGHCCRALSVPFTSGPIPEGIFNHVNFPMAEANLMDCNPSVHVIDVVTRHHLGISIAELETEYKAAINNKDLQLLPAPFGLRGKVSSECKIQLVFAG